MEFFDIPSILQGLEAVFNPQALLWLAIGVSLGLFGGTLPGISGSTMLAVLVAFTFQFPVDVMVIALAGIYAASVYSGSTSGILYNIPGDVSGIPATIEGYPMTRQGQAGEALSAVLGASFFGAILAFICMLFLVPTFMSLVTYIGTGERALFAIWALVIITGGVLTQDDTLRGLISMAIGLVIGMIGMQANVGAIRFTMDQMQLWDGVNLLWVILGLYAIPQILRLPDIKINKKSDYKLNVIEFYKGVFSTIAKHLKLMTRTSILGLILGIIPGIGSVTASWVGYSQAKKNSKNINKIGSGFKEGIIGAESANNAAVPGTFIPLFSLGIPGSAAGAIILGAFIVAGLFPGPQLMETNGPLVWTILFGIGLSGVVFLLLAVPFIGLAQRLVLMPSHYLVAVIGVLAIVGTYLSKFNIFGILVTIIIGLLAVAGNKIGLSMSAILLGYVLGPVIEIEVVRAYQVGGIERFFEPFSLVLMAIIVATFLWGLLGNKKSNKVEDVTAKEIEDSYSEIEDSQGNGLKDLLSGILGLVLAILVYVFSQELPVLAKMWPVFVAFAFLGIPSVFVLIRGLRDSRQIKNIIKNKDYSFNSIFNKNIINSIVIIAAMTLSVSLINVLGFIESLVLFTFIIMLYFTRSLVTVIFGSIVIGLFVWLLKFSFGFPFPTGILGL